MGIYITQWAKGRDSSEFVVIHYCPDSGKNTTYPLKEWLKLQREEGGPSESPPESNETLAPVEESSPPQKENLRRLKARLRQGKCQTKCQTLAPRRRLLTSSEARAQTAEFRRTARMRVKEVNFVNPSVYFKES